MVAGRRYVTLHVPPLTMSFPPQFAQIKTISAMQMLVRGHGWPQWCRDLIPKNQKALNRLQYRHRHPSSCAPLEGRGFFLLLFFLLEGNPIVYRSIVRNAPKLGCQSPPNVRLRWLAIRWVRRKGEQATNSPVLTDLISFSLSLSRALLLLYVVR